MTRRSPVGPYLCTNSSPGNGATACRTSSSVTAASANSTIATVPPAKSIPSGSPRVAIVVTPAAMTSAEAISACRPHRLNAMRVPASRGRTGEKPVISNSVLDTNTDVNTLATRPSVSVLANPRIELVPN